MRILVLDGHPDPDPKRFGHALVRAYAAGAKDAGHEVSVIAIGDMSFPLLRSAEDWETGEPDPAIRAAQDRIAWAQHLVLIYPLWLGALPALTKGFLEQVLRPGFAIRKGERSLGSGLLGGRSVRVIVTMGMPAFVYRWFFFALTLRSLNRNILKFCGFGPIRNTVIGLAGGADDAARQNWLGQVRALGAAAK